MSLKGSPSSATGSGSCGGAEGGGGGARGGAGGVKARFFSGGSPRFLVDNLLFSMMFERLTMRVVQEDCISCGLFRRFLTET